VDVVEPQPRRLAFAAELGGNPRAIADLAAGYPLVIEASGKAPARQIAIERIAPRGALVQLGEADRWEIEETRLIRRKDFFLIRSFYFAKGEFEENCALFRADRDAYARFVDAEAGLQGLSALFDDFSTGRLIKPALVLPH
jgi:L-iditol 2-dehydrogenase